VAYKQTPRVLAKLRVRDEAILEAAKMCIAEKGFAATRVRDIVKRAKCSTGAFYDSLGSKEAAVEALAAQLISEMTKELDKLWGEELAVSAFDLGIELVFEVFARDRERTVVVMSERGGGPEGQELYQRLSSAMVEFTVAQIDRGVREGVFVTEDTRLTASCVVGAITFFLTRWAILGQTTREEIVGEAPRVARQLWLMFGVEREDRVPAFNEGSKPKT
jgi:AcrR family transcriptional regulator